MSSNVFLFLFFSFLSLSCSLSFSLSRSLSCSLSVFLVFFCIPFLPVVFLVFSFFHLFSIFLLFLFTTFSYFSLFLSKALFIGRNAICNDLSKFTICPVPSYSNIAFISCPASSFVSISNICFCSRYNIKLSFAIFISFRTILGLVLCLALMSIIFLIC